jgi:hypothetical protein
MKKQKQSEFLTFRSGSDIALEPIPNRDLTSEFGKKNWQSAKIDEFERSLGISPPKAEPKLRFKSRVFTPEFEDDKNLLEELLNHPKYKVIYWKDNWTVNGSYKTYVVYSENLEYKEPEEKLKEIAKGK